MNTNILKLTAVLLCLAGSFACKQNETDSNNIPFIDYSLAGIDCKWEIINDNEIIIINSKEEMDKYVTFYPDYEPEIDFNKSTLLLTKISTTYGVGSLSKKFYEIESKYILDVTIVLNDATVVESRYIFMVTNKLKHQNVELKVNIIRN
ncbi:MAG: hypothetical protein LBT27_08980 [Prevotellaceae bacterium]|jgi:hypothetical protein|nr:hypothetical protein [Prevotellaceae bacterium]